MLSSQSDGTIPDKGLRLAIDHAKKRMKPEREFSFSEVSDVFILREVQRDLQIRGK